MKDSNDVTRSREMMNKFAGIMKNSNGHLKILINDNPALPVSLGSNIKLEIHDSGILDGVGMVIVRQISLIS